MDRYWMILRPSQPKIDNKATDRRPPAAGAAAPMPLVAALLGALVIYLKPK